MYDKEELATILGYDDKIEQNVEVINRGEFVDKPEPEEIKSEAESPVKNPWIQTAIILSFSCLAVAFIVTLVMGGGGGSQSARNEADKPKAIEEEETTQEEIGDWKTSAAIGEQQQLLQQQNQERQKTVPVTPTIKNTSVPKPIDGNNSTSIRSVTPIRNTVPTEPNTVKRIQTPPPLRVTSNTTTPQPLKVTRLPQVKNVSRINNPSVAPVPPTKQITWIEASNIGVFGGDDPQVDEKLPVETQQMAVEEEITEPVTLSEPIYRRPTDTEILAEEKTEPVLTISDEQIEEPNEKKKQKTEISYERKSIVPNTYREKSTDKLTPLNSERYLLENKKMQVRELEIGTGVKAEVIESLILNIAKGSKNVLLVRLTEDLLDVNGKVALPSGTIVKAIATIQDSGIVAAISTDVYLNNQKIEIPTSVFTLMGEGDEPVVATEYKPDSGVLSSDLQAIFWGAAGNVGKILTEPDVTVISNDSTIVTATENNRDVLGAAIDGGFTPYAEAQLERSRQRVEDLRSIESSWFLPAGLEVTLTVREPIKLRH